jgi:hypothetical protein
MVIDQQAICLLLVMYGLMSKADDASSPTTPSERLWSDEARAADCCSNRMAM